MRPKGKPRASQGKKPPIITREKKYIGIEAEAAERLRAQGLRNLTAIDIARTVQLIRIEKVVKQLTEKLGKNPTRDQIRKELKKKNNRPEK